MGETRTTGVDDPRGPARRAGPGGAGDRHRHGLPRRTAGSGAPAEGSHTHDVDPVSAVLLGIDGAVVVTVVVLLLRRPRRRPA
jgi:hypothetical protein